MSKYFIHNGKEQVGPYSLEDLRHIDIKRNCLVWRDGLDDWTKITDLSELNEILKNIPPDIKKSHSTPPPISIKKEYIYIPIKKRENPLVLILNLVLSAVIGAFVFHFIYLNYLETI